MFWKFWHRDKMINATLFVKVRDTDAYLELARVVGLLLITNGKRNERYCVNVLTSSTRWMNDEHTKAKINVTCTKKQLEIIKDCLDFAVYATSETV